MTKVTLIAGGRRQPEKKPDPSALYAQRKQIYPKLAHGQFRLIKWGVMAATLGVYYLIPWLRWPRGEGVPDQAVLADFEGERFYFFFLEIWPQEIYLLAGLLILAALGLFLVTSLFGRVWCGYTCPQTVWTDLYIWVERAFEGDRAARMRLDVAPWSLNKVLRKAGKHAVWILIAFLTGGAFILYWHDAPTIARTFFIGEAPLTAYFFAALLTFTTYILAGTMREQVCIYLCPWPRIQGALTDEHALNVTYRLDRGEPRAPLRKGETWEGRGDCIDCKQCVQVCPMGIDIRDGAQLECIHCGLCIDACDDMMEKIERPKHLIFYDTDAAVAARVAGEPQTYKFLRPRTLLYAGLIGLISALMLWSIANKTTFEASVLKDRSPSFVRVADGVRNGYTLKIVNKGASRSLALRVSTRAGARVHVIGLGDQAPGDEIILPAGSHGVDRYRIFVTLPRADASPAPAVTMTLSDPDTGETRTRNAAFVMPEQTP